MNRSHLGGLALVALIGPAPALPTAQPQAGPPSIAAGWTTVPGSRLWVTGSSTVRDFECAAKRIDGEIRTDPADAALALADLERAVTGAEVAVQAADLDCRNDAMNGHLRKALRADAHPVIRFRVDSLTVAVTSAADGLARLAGTLQLAGEERPLVVDVALAQAEDGALGVAGAAAIDMTEWGIKPPKLMLGALKVHDRVVVHFDVKFSR